MARKKDQIISAQVILRPAGGRALDGRAAITAQNVAEFAPSPSEVSRVTSVFRSRDFEVGPVVGVSFSATGPVRAFEEFFGMQFRLGKDGAYEFVAGDETLGHELSGARLPQEIREYVLAVAFPLPPDFGPTEFHP